MVLCQTFQYEHIHVLHSLRSVLRLRADPPRAIKQASEGVDLSDGNGEHDKQVEKGPEGHSPQVVL